jgi:HK97 family phage major capsid protein
MSRGHLLGRREPGIIGWVNGRAVRAMVGGDGEGDGNTITLPSREELEKRSQTLIQDLLTSGEKLRELREKEKDKRSPEWAEDLKETARIVMALDAEHTATERAYRAVSRQFSTDPSEPLAALLDSGVDTRSPGELFIASPEYRERRSARAVMPADVRTLITTSTSDTPKGGVWLPKGQPIPPREQRLGMFVRDLLTVQETSLASIPYIREVSPLVNETGASAVAEGAAKPEATMQWEQADAPARKIAVWVPVTEEEVSDAPTVRGYIDRRLVYMVKFREQDMILNGSGTAPQLLGIRNTPGIQSQSAVSGDVGATMGRAIGKIEVVDGEADGAVMHPTDFWTAVTTRFANQFDNGFGAGLPFANPPMGYWGLPTVRTRAMTLGKALVGSWALGATLFDRAQATVRTTDSHSDYFIYNKLVILAEERVALAVHRPDFFVEATL